MAHMRRTYLAAITTLALALGLPASAPATLAEVGVIGATIPTTVPSCPGTPCLAVSRTTGFQVKVGTAGSPMTIPHSGALVAWTISLGQPNATQIKFFNEHEGGVAEAGVAVLQPQKKPNLTYKLIAQSPMVKLEKWFGKTAEFPLETALQTKKGDIVALTVPTWAPALALGFGETTSWRASRQKGQCLTTSAQTTQTTLGKNVQYYCLYLTARLTYNATVISTP